MANQEQLQLLKHGYYLWNMWREKNLSVQINLAKTDLHEAGIHSVDLHGADLREANLHEAHMFGANLYEADLRKADLSSANLGEADLSGANLSEADLSSANLWRTNLSGANLSGANLSSARFWFNNLSDANLSGANLRGTDLRGANLRGANLRGTDLRGANLYGVYLSQIQKHQIEETMRNREKEKANYEKSETKGISGDEFIAILDAANERFALEKAEAESNAREEAERLAAKKAEEERFAAQKERKLRVSSQNEVFFTAYLPMQGAGEIWHTLLVYAHILPMIEKVREDAKRFNDQIKSPKETTSKSSTPIAWGTELTIIPSCEGVIFNPERVNLKWMEDFHRADFRFKADQSHSDEVAKGQITIYVGPIIVGTLKFVMVFYNKEHQSWWDKFLNFQTLPKREEHAKMYGRDDVFISYSRKDSEVARTFKTVLEGTGLDVFLDVDDLRSGQLWEEELKRRIEQAKIFQIFWSANYSQSENCKLEWEYALQQNKNEGYIRPVYWSNPLSPKPPEELNKFNFKYVELKIVNGE
jgi:uncharacterized protein YjbI with pentapeptide repeats